MMYIQVCRKEFVMSTPQKNNPPKKVGSKEEDKKLWPREDMRTEDEKANAEVERHLWPEGEVKEEEEEEKKVWPREGLRKEDEKADAEVERDLWTEDEGKKKEQPKKG
jgi:hypothetical protein